MPTRRAHRFCNTQPTTSFALLRIQLIIPPIIPGRASAAFIPNFPDRDAKALSLFLTHSFKPFSSLEEARHLLLKLHPHRLVIMLQQVPRWPS